MYINFTCYWQIDKKNCLTYMSSVFEVGVEGLKWHSSDLTYISHVLLPIIHFF